MSDTAHPPAIVSTTPTFATARDASWLPVDLSPRQVRPPASHTVHGEVAPALLTPLGHPIPDAGLAVIAGGHLVTSSGAVLDRAGDLVLSSLYDGDHYAREFSRPVPLASPTHHDGRMVGLVSLWSHAYFHWLLETLPRLAVLETSGISFDGIILPENASAFHHRALELAGFGDVPTYPLAGGHVSADELVWLAPLSPVGFPTDQAVTWLRAALGAPDIEPWRRIYLPRHHTRRVVNERQVLKSVRARGFEVVETDGLDLEAQVQLFAETRFAVGPHGAAFANGIFSRQLTAVEFYQPAHLNWSVTSTMAAAGHEHWSIVGTRIPSLGRPTHHNVYVSGRRLELTLDQAGIDT